MGWLQAIRDAWDEFLEDWHESRQRGLNADLEIEKERTTLTDIQVQETNTKAELLTAKTKIIEAKMSQGSSKHEHNGNTEKGKTKHTLHKTQHHKVT